MITTQTNLTFADRLSWEASNAVKIIFPDGTVMVGDKVVVAGRDAIVDGDRFLGWAWAVKKNDKNWAHHRWLDEQPL